MIFNRRRAALPRLPGNELLGNDTDQYLRQLRADLLLLVRRKDVDDTVDRIGRADGMQRLKRQDGLSRPP